MTTSLDSLLASIAVTGGGEEAGKELRRLLGGLSLEVRQEVRMVSLGCADDVLIANIRSAASK